MKKPYLFMSGQFALLAIVLFGISWKQEEGDFATVGKVFVGFGILLILIGFGFLGKSLTPNPIPKDSSKLVTTGIYSIVRHPIYVALMLICVGRSIWHPSWVSALATFLLMVLLNEKAKFEETLLHNRYGSEYKAYCDRVRRFFPRVY